MLNSSKTELLLLRPKGKRCNTRLTLKIKSKRIFPSNKVKYLGILLDSRLSWRSHLAELAKKNSKANGLLSRIRHSVDFETIRSLYYSLFHSHMTYGCLAWGLACKKELNRISGLQQQALRLITFSDHSTPTSEIFSRTDILKLEDVITLNLCLFIHDWHHKRLPSAFDDFFLIYSSNKVTRSNKVSKLSIPITKTEMYGHNNMKHKGAVMYNQLRDRNISISSSRSAYRNEIRSLLVAAYA